jgi:hypothetical protein
MTGLAGVNEMEPNIDFDIIGPLLQNFLRS